MEWRYPRGGIPQAEEEEQYQHHQDDTGYDVVLQAVHHQFGITALVVGDDDLQLRRKAAAVFGILDDLLYLFRCLDQVATGFFSRQG